MPRAVAAYAGAIKAKEDAANCVRRENSIRARALVSNESCAYQRLHPGLLLHLTAILRHGWRAVRYACRFREIDGGKRGFWVQQGIEG